MKKTYLLTIDPQNDFCTPLAPNANQATARPGYEKGALFVPGADEDMQRLAAFIKKNKHRLADISCTLDSHQGIHIAHPVFWKNSKGERPTPFTLISAKDVRDGIWSPFNPMLQTRAQAYVDSLEANGRYVLVIWPPHCLIGTWGAAVVPDVAEAFYEWETEFFRKVNFVPKGNNPFTEHYSGVQADVPDPADPTTKLNTALIDALNEADEILITGEALSHCVANTVIDIAKQFGEDNIKKFVLLEDTSSNVPTFEKLGEDFVKDFSAKGMQRTTTKDW